MADAQARTLPGEPPLHDSQTPRLFIPFQCAATVHNTLVLVGQTGNGGTMLVGAGWPYPPSFTALVRSVWAQRRPAVGATVKPGQDLNLVFGLTRTSATAGRSGGPPIGYTAGGSSYTVEMKTSLEVAAKC